MNWFEGNDGGFDPDDGGFDPDEGGSDRGFDPDEGASDRAFGPENRGFHPRGASDEPVPQRWPLDWRGLYPRERWLWFEQLWSDVRELRARYRLPVRTAWWEDEVQVEALAALAAWVERYDCGEWDDPPGKLALLFDLQRISELLRDGHEPFHPDRDRLAFARHLIDIGCQPPPGWE